MAVTHCERSQYFCSVTDDDDDVARGCDAQTLLDNIQTRNVFVDELLEVRNQIKKNMLLLRIHKMH